MAADPRAPDEAAAFPARGTMHGMPDPRVMRQLPGTTIVAPDGTLRLLCVARDAGGHLGAGQLLDAVEAIRRQDAAVATRAP